MLLYLISVWWNAGMNFISPDLVIINVNDYIQNTYLMDSLKLIHIEFANRLLPGGLSWAEAQ
jgi:hypothetical protein